MPNEASQKQSLPTAGMVNERVSDITKSNNWMVVTYEIVDGQVKINWYTHNYPKNDFNKSVTMLQNELTKELEKK